MGGEITLRFSTVGLQQTKAADGGGIAASTADASKPDLVILIADSQGNVVVKYPQDGSLISSTFTEEAIIKFDFSARDAGQYTVYAFGNTEGLWDMTTDGSNTITDLTTLATAAQVEALRFTDLADPSGGLAVKNSRLPLSARASLTVSTGKNGEAYLELLRCVAKVTAKFINNTGEDLALSSYTSSFRGISPNCGYVLPHDPDFPEGATTGDLSATEEGLDVPADAILSKDWYVFPSMGPYTSDIGFTLGGKAYTYNDLPVTNWRAEDIPALGRNQHITIETRISKGLTVSFNFKVAAWEPHSAAVVFD